MGYFQVMAKNRLDALRRFTIRHTVTEVTVFYAIKNGNPIVSSIVLGGSPTGRKTAPETAPDPRISSWIKNFLDGKENSAGELPVDLSPVTPFARKVLLAARSIPRGTTISYAGLAKISGNPKAARAVASVMRNNPLPLIIPCHRVIRSNGSIGGFMGKQSGKEVELKKRLLEREASGLRLRASGTARER